MKGALFLDRDGVINDDLGYVHRREDFRFVPGVFDLARAARDLGLAIHVVTNQAGIGRGLYTEAQFHDLSDWMRAEFAREEAPVEAVHHCPCHPEHGTGETKRACRRRKPEPGMMVDAAMDYALDLGHSAMVGDKATDMVAARAAGVGVAILMGDRGEWEASPPGTLHARDHGETVSLLREHLRG